MGLWDDYGMIDGIFMGFNGILTGFTGTWYDYGIYPVIMASWKIPKPANGGFQRQSRTSMGDFPAMFDDNRGYEFLIPLG
jgi:hypothetical protein